MMRRRAVGRRVARVAVGTAVMAGTAGAVHHAQQKHWDNKDAEAQAQYDQAYQQGAADVQQQHAPPPPVQPAPAGDDLTVKLQQLADLHASGVLTDEEFAAAKQKLLTA